MTGRELIALIGSNPWQLAGLLAVPPFLALAVGFAHAPDRGGEAPWKYCYSAVIYAACIPGMLAAVLTASSLMHPQQSLLDQDLLVYIGPFVAMVVTLVLVRNRVSFDQVPGFDRITGLMTIIALTFVIVLALSRTRIFIGFGGSLPMLLVMCAAVFALLKWAASMVVRGPRDPLKAPPRLDLM